MSQRKVVRRARKRPAPKRIVRRPRKMTGYGAYKAIGSDNASDAYARGKAAGLRSKKRSNNEGGIGARIGGAIGSGLGTGVEHFVKWISGLGDYEIKENALLTQDPPPMVNESNKGGTLIRHREYLQDIFTAPVAGDFKLDAYFINPANEKTFPFLHQVAMNYEQYSLEGMIFEYRSMSADALNSTNTALGSVIMATNYDALDANFKQKSEMENYEFGNSCKPSASMMHPIECAPKQTVLTELYTLNGVAPVDADLRFYHWGKFQIATVGFQAANVNIGELWVTYQVRLLKPKLYTAIGLEIGTFATVNNSYTNALPLGNGTVTSRFDSIGIAYDPVNSNIGFPIYGVRKAYLINLIWIGSLTAITVPTISLINGSYLSIGSPAGGNVTQVPPNAQSTSRVEMTFAMINAANLFNVITLGGAGTLPTGGTTMSIQITEINPFNF